jgi:hypothetical protein
MNENKGWPLADFALSTPAETVEARITRLGLGTVAEYSAGRLDSLNIANRLVDDFLFGVLARVTRLSRLETICLPAHRYEGLSRGRGWARQGKGDSVVWGERVEGRGYRCGPGKWVVGATDGFRRKDSATWDVTHVLVGTEKWTMAE